MALALYSTLTRRVEPFEPITPGEVKMYVCGVTVYDYCHIGHARTFVAFDIIRRWLEASDYKVTFVRNVTDVDDKIIRRAAERGITPDELSRIFTVAMQEDMTALGCLTPTKEPRATDFIPQMLNLVKVLEEKGLAYVADDGDVDFAVRRFPGYGKLSGRELDELQSGARIEANTSKRDPLDFVLWKSAKPGEPQWDSPWGPGRPGWHIECSAMACNILGVPFDIHGGGPDLMFPHHENEIAQSEGATGTAFAHYWMHTGALRVKNADGTEEKMSKSLGNFWTIRDALAQTNERYGDGIGNEVLRFFLMKTHYRSSMTFSPDLIEDAKSGLNRLYGALDTMPEIMTGTPDWTDAYGLRFKAAMDDDFNAPQAIAVLFDLASDIHRAQDDETRARLVAQLRALGQVLNILGLSSQAFRQQAVGDTAEIEALIEERTQAKQAKNWARADEIRQILLERGIELLDGPQGTTWRARD